MCRRWWTGPHSPNSLNTSPKEPLDWRQEFWDGDLSKEPGEWEKESLPGFGELRMLKSWKKIVEAHQLLREKSTLPELFQVNPFRRQGSFTNLRSRSRFASWKG